MSTSSQTPKTFNLGLCDNYIMESLFPRRHYRAFQPQVLLVSGPGEATGTEGFHQRSNNFDSNYRILIFTPLLGFFIQRL